MQDQLNARIETLTGERPTRLSELSGGCVGEVYRVTLASGRDLVAKVGPAGSSGLTLEGFMLEYLSTHSQLPVPQVIHADDQLLLMTMLEVGGGLGTVVQRDAARHVSALHANTCENGYGFACDTVIGGLHQPNPWTPHWCDFFRDQRLMYMGREAARVGRLPVEVMNRLSSFCEVLERWISEPKRPSLIHGDMWTGNVLSAHERISGFIDPAIYYADPEIELAFTTLFATFGDAFFSRYHELSPIRPGFFEERRDIYNLYPLLVHVRLFGGSYVASVDRTLRKFGY
ncbi:fructosamine kinase family protein [Magnetovibrio sp.]|uniref:fructosamine kinase family protein n=1 Tax=Magnetovibrio sp. TaxID=2024836 RepID=UPI002F93A864